MPLSTWLADLRDDLFDDRAGWRDVLGCLVGHVRGVELDALPMPDEDERDDSTREAVTPLERLEHDVGIARDFRGWPRDEEYDPKRYGWPKNKKRGRSRGVRRWADIDTIVLHTAGVELGMHADRWLGVPCHAAVSDSGSVVLCHDLTAYLWAAHDANSYSVSLEIAGDRTLTDDQRTAARALLRYMADEIRRHREGPVKVIPHRFSHKSRPLDPGALIWREVGEWGVRELGLLVGDVVGSGRPLPFP